MSTSVEVVPARRHSRARFLVLVPLLPALAALALVALAPFSSASPFSTVSADQVAESLPETVDQPTATPVKATPAVTASPSPSAAAEEIFTGPPVKILPPPKPTGHRSGHVVSGGRCSAYGITTKSVSSAPYSAQGRRISGYINDERALDRGVQASAGARVSRTRREPGRSTSPTTTAQARRSGTASCGPTARTSTGSAADRAAALIPSRAHNGLHGLLRAQGQHPSLDVPSRRGRHRPRVQGLVPRRELLQLVGR